MDTLRIYRIDDRYISFLHGADNRVQFNKEHRRPYVGIVLEVGSYRYFVPLESPKPNHKNLRPGVHIMLLNGGAYGQLGFNNMIPVHPYALIEFNFSEETDQKYVDLLKRQNRFINQHKGEVYSRASRTYFRATSKSEDTFFKKICCDFKKLERSCDRYDPNYRSLRKK